ncbi:MAG: glutathione synthase [Betaproteobacteria bacterium]|nr:glutathione synthase [Betaproteobacteria bacterium]
MRIGFITDPIDSLKIKKDSTYAMMAEAARRGHELHVMQQDDLVWKRNRVFAAMRRITLTDSAGDWYALGPAIETLLADLDCVVMRKDPPFDVEYVTSTWLLEQAQREGAKIFNDPRALRDHSEKLAIAQFPRFTAPTLVSRSAKEVQAFIDEYTDVVLKPLDGMGGQSIFRVAKSDPNRNVIVETLSNNASQTIMAQRYIPEIRDGDKRVLVIGGKPVPYCLARIPKAGESRGNLAAGGTGVARPLSTHDLEIAGALGPELARRGLLLVGLDVIGDFLTEINVTSPTCFREITDQTGFNVAGMFMDELQAACAA